MSKFSFQYGLSVFLMTLVVCICSPSTETMANGSGSRRRSRLMSESAATTGGMVSHIQGKDDTRECVSAWGI